jgi:hypothetical protein
VVPRDTPASPGQLDGGTVVATMVGIPHPAAPCDGPRSLPSPSTKEEQEGFMNDEANHKIQQDMHPSSKDGGYNEENG